VNRGELKTKRFYINISLALFITSCVLYGLHYLIFRDSYFLGIYILDHLAFLPIEILMVTIVIGSVLEFREKNQRLEKLNMVLGSFYSEIGHDLLKFIGPADPDLTNKLELLRVNNKWTHADFTHVQKKIKDSNSKITIDGLDLINMKLFLKSKREFLLRLMENPNLLEHDLLTNLMQATFHLLEELEFRPGFDNLPKPDLDHLCFDTKRVYIPLIIHWLEYMYYLKVNFPYLFSLAIRINPFDKDASVIIYE
jgi:hypothetical protein